MFVKIWFLEKGYNVVKLDNFSTQALGVKMRKRILGITMLCCLLSVKLMAESGKDYQFNENEYIKLRYITFDSDVKKPFFQNNTVEWYYNSLNQEYSIFTKEEVIETIKKAMLSWSKYGDIAFVYKGETTNNINDANDGIVTIGYWSESAFANEFGEYGGYTDIWWNGDKIIYEAYVILNAGNNGYSGVPKNLNELQGLVTHEIGHVLGIEHSDIEESIMYANPDHSYLYQTVLKVDDISIVQLLYPPLLDITYPIGWTLSGVGKDENIDVTNIKCEDNKTLALIWKYKNNQWNVYTPTNIDYGYTTFDTINNREGFWVNCY